MKTLVRFMLAILMLAFANGQTTIYEKDDIKLVLDGHIETFFGTDSPFINPDSVHFGDFGTTIRPIVRFNSDSLFAVFEPNISIVGIDNSNWLLQAAVGYKITPDFSVLMGCIMTSSIFLTPPARFNPLVRCPRFPMGVYGYGIQLNDNLSENLNVMWDVTTDTGYSFQDRNRFDGLETSLQLTYKFNEAWRLAGNYAYDFQYNDSFFGLDAEYKKGPWDIRLVGYAKEDKLKSDILGAYLIGAYLLTPHLEIDGGFDFQCGHGSSETIGLRVFLTEDQKTDIRLDCIHTNGFGPQKYIGAFGFRRRF